ncbi:hypothetical protein PZN02_003049 [Sinorhizobium garamanticum]|uniref:Uncharacterized protein n=1 Tax=Sinorhizobium garamanticum TaxID=680247 RepID=A0ABY8D780_9HYPH|nr:hypothetical protein [Sinorhizobium garamanticum]WEX86724.1 hypothetical protein PZN02_003049 [Sinorhizobium garamanticum]
MVTVADINLTWVQKRADAYCAKLGDHEMGFVLKRQARGDWAWTIWHCNGTGSDDFRHATTLDAAQAQVLAGVKDWFRQAGFS